MLELRPIVIDDTMIPLGGNMRIKALTQIAAMDIDEISKRLESIYDFKKKSKDKRQKIVKYWKGWLKEQTIQVTRAKHLTEEEKQQFIIKDNVSFGEWNFEALKNWDNEALNDWGFDFNFKSSSKIGKIFSRVAAISHIFLSSKLIKFVFGSSGVMEKSFNSSKSKNWAVCLTDKTVPFIFPSIE